MIKNSDDPKTFRTDLIKVCAKCGISYHPRRNGYAETSKYCSAKCSRDATRSKFVIKSK